MMNCVYLTAGRRSCPSPEAAQTCKEGEKREKDNLKTFNYQAQESEGGPQ